MGFRCPECGRDELEIGRSIELGADSRSDEITLQLARCAACAFGAVAVYQESRRGSLEQECVEHIGYRAPPTVLEQLERLLASCPRPRESGCGCAAHSELQCCNAGGTWDPPIRRDFGAGFAMQHVP